MYKNIQKIPKSSKLFIQESKMNLYTGKMIKKFETNSTPRFELIQKNTITEAVRHFMYTLKKEEELTEVSKVEDIESDASKQKEI